MKASMMTLCCVFVIAAPLLFTGCEKHDYPHEPARCQIYKMHFTRYNDMDSAVFTYNKKGDPIRVTRGVNATGRPDMLFWYDKRGRLTDFIGVYHNGDAYEFRHIYTHDYKDRIITDTMHVFGAITGPLGSIANITKYKYDAQDRIIQMDYSVPDYPHSSYTYFYFYNQQGNLAKITNGGSVIATPVYDDKINMNNLHPIWQFMQRDYSRNNPFQAVLYDQLGLPLYIKPSPEQNSENFVNIYYDSLRVEYKCR